MTLSMRTLAKAIFLSLILLFGLSTYHTKNIKNLAEKYPEHPATKQYEDYINNGDYLEVIDLNAEWANYVEGDALRLLNVMANVAGTPTALKSEIAKKTAEGAMKNTEFEAFTRALKKTAS